MTALSRFARLLDIPSHQAGDALYSERAARAVLTRRSFFAAGAAMAAGAAFSFPANPQLVAYYGFWYSNLLHQDRPVFWAPAGEPIPRGAMVELRDDLLYVARARETIAGNRFSHMITYCGTAA